MKRPLFIVLVAGIAASATGQTIEWNNASGGDWNTAANWNPQNVPNSGGENASIALGGVYTVTLGVSPTIGALSLSNPTATLDIFGGAILTISNASTTNEGVIRINGNETTGNAQFRTTVNTTVLGQGEIVLLLGSGDLNDAILTTVNAQMTLGPDQVVRGAGTISGNINNLGAIRADSATETLRLTTLAKINDDGLMEAVGGGTLRIDGITITQQKAAAISADGGRVELASGSVTGGLLSASPGSVIETVSGTNVLTDVTLEGDLFIQDTTVCALKNGLLNNGRITINPDPGAGNATLRSDNALLIDGVGEVLMLLGSNDLNDAIFSTANAVVVTQGESHTIRGSGNLAANLVNNGTVLADAPAGILQLGSLGKTNNAFMGATGGGILRIASVTVTQSPEGVLSADDGVVSLATGSVTGGKLASSGAGLIEGTSGNNTLTDVENNGHFGQLSGSNTLIKGAGLTNNGTIEVNSNGGTGNSLLRFDQNGTLAGTGEIVLRLGSADLNDAQFGTLNSTVTMDADHTIRGAGNLTGNLVSSGAVIADSAGEALQLASLEKTNNGLMAATDGILRVNGIKITQGGGAIRADGGVVELMSATIIGGEVSSSDGGVVRSTSGTSTLEDVVFAGGRLEINDQTVVDVKGDGLINDGAIVVNAEGQTGNAALRFATPSVLEGTGEVSMILGSTDLNDAQIVVSANMSLAVGEGQRIVGSGNFNASGPMTLNGTVAPGSNADRTGKFGGSGKLTLGSSAVLEMDVGGAGDGQFDTIGGSQQITLAGTLKVSLVDGFVPDFGDKFAVVNTSGSVAGEFEAVTGSAGPGAVWKAIYSAKKVEVIVTCYADTQPDGVLDLFDFLAYVNLFNAGSPEADCIQDGVLDLFDFLCYVNAFNVGC